jgi:BMFP domain-containing protein YqiC
MTTPMTAEDELRRARAELVASQRDVVELRRDLEAQRITLLRGEARKESLQAQLVDLEVRVHGVAWSALCSAGGLG